MSVEWHLHFYGRVQGVGFRAACYHIAKSLDLKGSVENLSDGSVLAIVQGSEPQAQELELLLREQFPAHIERVVKENRRSLRQFSSFEIIHS